MAEAGERSRRVLRRQAVSELRARGRYGPRLREVLFALVLLVLLGSAGVVGLALAFRVYGPAVPAAVLAALVTGAVAARLLRRPLARRRRGLYTPDELAELDVPGLVLAVARMLRRDGWRVLPLPEQDRPRLAARDAQGRLLVVAFRPVAEPLPDEEPAWRRRARGHGPVVPDLRLVVHRGTFAERDVRWAARQGHVHLIDGARLARWAGGTPLHRLGDESGVPGP
ncbi:hypothetical protein ACIRPS_02405 [Streptomyces griseoviridis]